MKEILVGFSAVETNRKHDIVDLVKNRWVVFSIDKDRYGRFFKRLPNIVGLENLSGYVTEELHQFMTAKEFEHPIDVVRSSINLILGQEYFEVPEEPENPLWLCSGCIVSDKEVPTVFIQSSSFKGMYLHIPTDYASLRGEVFLGREGLEPTLSLKPPRFQQGCPDGYAVGDICCENMMEALFSKGRDYAIFTLEAVKGMLSDDSLQEWQKARIAKVLHSLNGQVQSSVNS